MFILLQSETLSMPPSTTNSDGAKEYPQWRPQFSRAAALSSALRLDLFADSGKVHSSYHLQVDGKTGALKLTPIADAQPAFLTETEKA